MKHNSKGEVLTCFYITNIDNKDYFRIKFLTLDGGLIKGNNRFTDKSFECSNVNYFKTD